MMIGRPTLWFPKTTMMLPFNICKSPRDIRGKYDAMRKSRTYGCWLVLGSRYFGYGDDAGLPIFNIDDHWNVALNYEDDMLFDDFIESIISGRIHHANEMIVNSMEIEFVENDCWKCGAPNHEFFVRELRSANGIVYHPDQSFDFILANPPLLNAITQYLASHPELQYKVGGIKQRYSRTVGEYYMSFGCQHCDAIFGNFPLSELMIEFLYEPKNPDHCLTVEVNGGYKMEIDCWFRES